MSKPRRPSLMSGLLWTGVGMLFLLRNFGIGPDFWSMASRYWPILLILLGLGKVIDYYRQKEGVSLRFGEIFGILFLILVGTIATKIAHSPFREAIRNIPIRIGGESITIEDFMGTSFSFTDEAQYPLTKTVQIRIENSYGAVVVSPGSDGEVRVRLRKVVYHDAEARAKEIAGEIKVQGGADGQSFVVKTNRDALASKEYRFKTDLEVFVPKKSQVQVRNSRGEVRVNNIEGKLDLGTTNRGLEARDCIGDIVASNRYAEARFFNITGNLQIENRGRVYLETIRGDVNVRGEAGAVEVSDVTGKLNLYNAEGSVNVKKVTKPVEIDARGSEVYVSDLSDTLKLTSSHRSVKISDVSANVTLDTRYSSVSLKDIKGSVDAASTTDRFTADEISGSFKLVGQGTSVRINNVAGPVDINTSRRNVIVNDFASSCKVTNEFSDVKLSTKRLGKDDITVKNRNGLVELFLPENDAFQIDAVARYGRVDSDFPGLEPVTEKSDTGILKGRARGGGPKIQLETEYNNISLRTLGRERRERTN